MKYVIEQSSILAISWIMLPFFFLILQAGSESEFEFDFVIIYLLVFMTVQCHVSQESAKFEHKLKNCPL